ncbi:MAG TPA: SRPBCC domain-containing protein, partial [Xanthobacteraceae bacterium]|nr:SRPBCC domain-containing protein [Xanthobacteraceae bacterium]
EPTGGPEVKLTVTHDEFEPGSKVHAAVSNGWPMILSSLKSLLETGRPSALTSPEKAHDARERAIALAESNAG